MGTGSSPSRAHTRSPPALSRPKTAARPSFPGPLSTPLCRGPATRTAAATGAACRRQRPIEPLFRLLLLRRRLLLCGVSNLRWHPRFRSHFRSPRCHCLHRHWLHCCCLHGYQQLDSAHALIRTLGQRARAGLRTESGSTACALKALRHRRTIQPSKQHSSDA